jgi:hypothetical protein
MLILLVIILFVTLTNLAFAVIMSRIMVKQSTEMDDLFEEMQLQRLNVRRLLNWAGGVEQPEKPQQI